MSEGRGREGQDGEHGDQSGQRDQIVSEYVDRLIAGEKLDPLEVIERCPEDGQEILEEIYTFLELGQQIDHELDEEPLGSLGDYTLRRQIGRGGMGVVYEAWENSMDRAVALKVLPAGIAADTRACSRFIREAQAAGKLSHPNVVPVFFMGVKEQTPFYAMELVEGETLAQVLARISDAAPGTETPFGPKDQVDYFAKLARAFAEVAGGLQHAHSKGVIHRDIKPSNLILDGEGRLRILDFGLARLEGQESLTLSGDFVGTPAYMSPEQARRKKVPIDRRTDIYSLGATMYEALTLRPPFRGKNPGDTLSQIIERDPAAPRKLSPRLPRDLETIVLKCLRKDPGDRYRTAEGLAQDLGRFVRGDPIEAAPQPAWEKAARRLWRHRATVTAIGAFLALAVAGLAAANVVITRQRDTSRRDLYFAHMQLAYEDYKAGNTIRFGELLDLHRPGTGASEPRRWEWYYLLSLRRQELVTLDAHSESVNSVAWNPDGKRLASGSHDGLVKVWNALTRENPVTLRHGHVCVNEVAWNPDARRLASAGADGVVRIWDPAAGIELLSVAAHPSGGSLHPRGGACTVAWDPDGKLLASGGKDEVKVWDTESAGEIREVKVLQSPPGERERSVWLWSVAWSPGGGRLAAAVGEDVVIWEVATWQQRARLEGHSSHVEGVAWSPDGRRLASAGRDRTVKIWNTDTGDILHDLRGLVPVVRDVAWSPEGAQLAASLSDGTITIWDAVSGEELASLRGHSGSTKCLDWSPDGLLASGSYDRTIKVWDPETLSGVLTLRGRHAVSWSPDGQYLATCGETVAARVFDAETIQEVVALGEAREAGSFSLAWTSDSARLAVARESGEIQVFAIPTGEERLGFPAHEGPVRTLAWSPDDRLLASGGADLAVGVWDGLTGAEVKTLRGHRKTPGSVAWSPGSQLLVTADWLQEVKVWETESWREIDRLSRDPRFSFAFDGQYFVAWGPRGDRLALGSSKGALVLYDVAAGREIYRRQGHALCVQAVAWSPDGQRLATASNDHTVKIWDAPDGRELLTLPHAGRVHSVAWHPDGLRLATVDDNSVKIWDASPGAREDEAARSGSDSERR